MLYEVLKAIRNFFVFRCYYGRYTIEDGGISLPNAQNGQYILIEGSIFNDGVHIYPCGELTDETFNGSVSLLAIPKDLLNLVDKIEEYERNDDKSGYTSESFGGYSYTRATVNGAPASWQSVFSNDLKKWRKI